MGVTTYYSVGGEIIGERSGGVRTDYLRDALGSVTATKRTDRSTISNTYRYKPYGERLAKTGVAADPRFQWLGTAGYRENSSGSNFTYGLWTHYDNLTSSRFSATVGSLARNRYRRGEAGGFPADPIRQEPVIVELHQIYWEICRGAFYEVWFKNPMKGKKGKGAIVQYVEARVSRKDCDGVEDFGYPQTLKQWEAWQFKDGKYQPPPGAGTKELRDTFGDGVGKECTTKTGNWFASIGYYEPYDVLANGFTYDVRQQLYSRSTNPGLAVGVDFRSFWFTYTCCDKPFTTMGVGRYSGEIPFWETFSDKTTGFKCKSQC